MHRTPGTDARASAPTRVRRGRERVLGGLALGLVVLAGAVVAPAAPAQASDAGTLVSLTNAERTERGLPRYSVSSDLASVALQQARRMAAANDLFHNPRLGSDVDGWRYVGENVGYSSSLSKLFTAWMNSAPHRANILDRDFTQIGIGVVRDDNGRIWAAQVFRKPLRSSTSSSSSSGSSSTTSSKPAAKKRSSTPRTTQRPKATTSSRASNASPAPTRSAPPSPRPTARPASSPAPSFEQKVASVTQWRSQQGPTDPVSDALAFAQAMAALG